MSTSKKGDTVMKKTDYLKSLLEKDEQLKKMKGYSGRYYITNKGRIFSCKRLVSGKLKIAQLNPARYGKNGAYSVVNLYNDDGSKTYYVHKLVEKYFKNQSTTV